MGHRWASLWNNIQWVFPFQKLGNGTWLCLQQKWPSDFTQAWPLVLTPTKSYVIFVHTLWWTACGGKHVISLHDADNTFCKGFFGCSSCLLSSSNKAKIAGVFLTILSAGLWSHYSLRFCVTGAFSPSEHTLRRYPVVESLSLLEIRYQLRSTVATWFSPPQSQYYCCSSL